MIATLVLLVFSVIQTAPPLSPPERAIVEHVDAHNADALALLGQTLRG